MKTIRQVCTVIVAVVGFAFAHVASADPCVAGSVDSLIGSANPANSGQATEEGLLEGFLGGANVMFDYRLSGGDTPDPGFNITACANNANQFYISVAPDEPGYFVLKFGDGGVANVNDTFFFTNVAALSELVFTSSQVECLVGGPGCPTNANIGRLSHYSLYDGNGLLIPEPGSLALLGIGVLALALSRRRRKV